MNIIRINPKLARKVSISSAEFYQQHYSDEVDEDNLPIEFLSVIECDSVDLDNTKPIILPQYEIGSFRIGEPYIIKMISMHNISATIIGEDENFIYVSLTELQSIAHDSILNECAKKGFINAEIINIVKFGAYVMVIVSQGEGSNEMNCFKTYLLKNSEFSVDHTPIAKIYQPGDKINIKVSEVPKENGDSKILIEAFEKYENQNKVDINSFCDVTNAIGYVSSINATMTFVTLADGIDALVNLAPNCQNVRFGSKVIVSRIKLVEKESGTKIAGIITNVLEY